MIDLDENIQLTRLEELVGHTIKAAIESPNGKYCDGSEIVLVTETGCFMVLDVDNGYSPEESSIRIVYPSRTRLLKDYLSPQDLLHDGLISHAEYALLKVQDDARLVEENKVKAARLRKELQELERGDA